MNKEAEVAELIGKAAKSDKSEDALRFSQAACNAANAMCAVASSKMHAVPSSKTIK